ncbi:MAG: carboxylate-amine ligase, partial [Gemmatimonadales bacterium]
ICRDVSEVRADLDRILGRVRAAGAAVGVTLAAAGSHPFARHRDRLIYPAERYRTLIDRNRWLAQRLMIFGLHVHLGVRDGDHAMAMINGLTHYLPHLLAISASSPFWQGSDTGLASSRIAVFEALPTAGHPCTFETWQDFVRTYDAMIASRAITSVKDLWWDIRPHPAYGTVEIRICDGLPTLTEAVSLVALVHALATRLDAQIRDGRRFLPPAYWILRENKWRASRWGLEAEIVMDDSGRTSLLRTEVQALVRALGGVAARLRGGAALESLAAVLERDPSYVRQRKIFERQQSLVAVAQSLVQEFATDTAVETR